MRTSAASRHLLLTSALAASVVAAAVWLSPVSVTVEVPWWRRVVPATPNAPSAREEVAPVPAAPHPSDRKPAIFWLWLAGVGVTVTRAAGQAAIVRRIRRRSRRVRDASLTQAFRLARSHIRFDGRADLRISSEIDIPFVTGLVRPAILIPSEAIEWSADEARSVLAHELAHLARRDLWTRAIARTACALHWFNPLVWWLAAAADRAAEHAADDLALVTGIRPSTYAETLLSLAEQLSTRAPGGVVLAFARASSLESRIRAVLEPARNRHVLGGGLRLTVIAGTSGVVGILGCVRVTPHTQAVGRSTPTVASTPTAIVAVAPTDAADSGRTPVAAATRRGLTRAAPPRPPTASTDWVDEAVKGLVDVLDDPSPQVRDAAARSLRAFDDPRGSAAVDRALEAANRTRASIDRSAKDK